MLVAAFALAACGGAAGGGGGGAPSLDQTYSQGGVTFKYPAGWVVEGEEGFVLLASNQATLDKATDSSDIPSLDAGQMAITLVAFNADIAELMGATTPLAVLQQMTEETAGEDTTFEAPTETTIAGKPAARANGTNGNMDAQFVALDLGDSGFVLLGGVAPKGDLSKIQATVEAIAATVTMEATSG